MMNRAIRVTLTNIYYFIASNLIQQCADARAASVSRYNEILVGFLFLSVGPVKLKSFDVNPDQANEKTGKNDS